MAQNFKSGAIPLKLLLLLSLSGFLLVKTISDYQSKVTNALAARYDNQHFSLSQHIGAVNTWQTYKSRLYNYEIRYPKVWKEPKGIDKLTKSDFQVQFAGKVKLQVDILKTFKITENTKTLQIGKNVFHQVENAHNKKSAVTASNFLNYQITLTAENYFESSQEFESTFLKVLKNFNFSLSY